MTENATTSNATTGTAPVRRVVVWLTIGSFGIAALMGIVALLGGGSFGEREGQVLMTTLVVGCTSVAMLCYLATSGTRFQAVGALGGITALVPAVTALLFVWNDDAWGDGVWKIFGVGLTVALTLAQLALLLALAGDRRRIAWVLWSTVVLAAVLAAIVSAIIAGFEPDEDLVFRVIGVIAILDVLGTVITLALALFGHRDSEEPGGPVRIPTRLESRLTAAAQESGTTRERVVADALDAWLSR